MSTVTAVAAPVLRTPQPDVAKINPAAQVSAHYLIDEDGTIRTVVIVPPTSQNQRRMEDDLRAVLPGVLNLDNEAAARACERVIRCYDPCISCATHFLRLEVTHA